MTDSTARFGDRADDYARYRPGYPAAAIAAVLDGFPGARVADLGAGTGISAALLADAGALVYAVEPNAAMRAAIPAHRRIIAVSGTAELTGLDPASIDVVTAFQAYHWFDPARVFVEAGRVARSRARFAAVWNERDERTAFTRAYGAIIAAYMTDATESRRRTSAIDADLAAYGWSPVHVVTFEQTQRLDWDGLIGRTRSASYLPREGAAYEAMARELRALYDATAADGAVDVALLTTVHLGQRS